MLSLSMVSSFTCANTMDFDMNCEYAESKMTCLESFEVKAKGVMKEQQNFNVHGAKHYIASDGLSNISFSDAVLKVRQKKAPRLYKKLSNTGLKHAYPYTINSDLKYKVQIRTSQEFAVNACSYLLSQSIYLKMEHDENFKDHAKYQAAHCNIVNHYQESQKHNQKSQYWNTKYDWFKAKVLGNKEVTDKEISQYYDKNCKKYEDDAELLQREMYNMAKMDENFLNVWSRCVGSYTRNAVTMSLSPSPKEGTVGIVVTNEESYGGGALSYNAVLVGGLDLDEEKTKKANKDIIEGGILGVAEVSLVPKYHGTGTAFITLLSPYKRVYSKHFSVEVEPPKPPKPPKPPIPPSHLEAYAEQEEGPVECFVSDSNMNSGEMTYTFLNKSGLPMVIRDIDIDGKEVTVQSKLPAIDEMYMPRQLKVKLQGLPEFGETNISVYIQYQIDDGSHNGRGIYSGCTAGFKLIYDKYKGEGQ